VPNGRSTSWRICGPWDSVITEEHYGARSGDPGVHVEPISNIGMASLIAAHGTFERVASAFRAQHEVALQPSPAVQRGRQFDLVWTAPEQWLAVAPGNRSIAADLQSTVGSVCAVADQTGGRAVLRVSGPRFRRALAKGCPIDLDPHVFTEGTAAATSISLMGVNVWRIPGEDAIHIALFRSMAASFWCWLHDSSAEFGLQVIGKS
jgi:heterotetrameric sarcosine oxidase gamma subunit